MIQTILFSIGTLFGIIKYLFHKRYFHLFVGRMEIFKGFVNDCEYLVRKSTAFCMLIPGFKSLCGDDRLSLLKSMFQLSYYLSYYLSKITMKES